MNYLLNNFLNLVSSLLINYVAEDGIWYIVNSELFIQAVLYSST